MLNKIITSIVFVFIFASCFGSDSRLHVIHNIYEGGFSIDGHDLFFDDDNKSSIKLGDRFYIDDKQVEMISPDSYYETLLLTNTNRSESKFFKSRIISNKKFFTVENVEDISNGKDYKLTLEDGSTYLLEQSATSSIVEAGDVIFFGDHSYYAVGKNLYGNFVFTLKNGSKHLGKQLSVEESALCKKLYYNRELFFGGAFLKWEHTLAPTWNYPYCSFPFTSIVKDGVCVSSPVEFSVSGLFKKPNPLVDVNTYRIRYASEYEISRNPIFIQKYYILEFYDFNPGAKFNIDTPSDLQYLKSANMLEFIEKLNDKLFIFRTPGGKKIQLSLNFKIRSHAY